MPIGEDRLTGKAAFVVIGKDDAELPITKFRPKYKRSFQDSTDSTWWHEKTELIYPTRWTVAIEVEIEIEGVFRYSVIPSRVIEKLFDGTNALLMSFYLENGYQLLTGAFDVIDFDMSVPIEDVVTYSMTVKSYGTFGRSSDFGP